MTIKERVEKLRHLITCLKCDVSGKPCDVNCPTRYSAGNMGEIIENLEEIAKILEQEPTQMIDKSNFSQEQYKTDLQGAYDCGKSVLDKIRAEIQTIIGERNLDDYDFCSGLIVARKIIDKYRAGSEGNNDTSD